jgi:hypothetical protein
VLCQLFGEQRRRTKVIAHAFGECAVLKLMYAALIRAAERWHGLRMTEFERRQLTGSAMSSIALTPNEPRPW